MAVAIAAIKSCTSFRGTSTLGVSLHTQNIAPTLLLPTGICVYVVLVEFQPDLIFWNFVTSKFARLLSTTDLPYSSALLGTKYHFWLVLMSL